MSSDAFSGTFFATCPRGLEALLGNLEVVLCERVTRLLGFDFEAGRLDVSTHPFCGGVPEDVRLTTRFREDEFLVALMGTTHETGHGRYEQNRPRELLGQPVESGEQVVEQDHATRAAAAACRMSGTQSACRCTTAPRSRRCSASSASTPMCR